MRKLNKKKIKWIVKEVERRGIGVWTIAKQYGITPRGARELPRKYKCYQRKHSNSLWHTDWFQYKLKWYILFEDDASRFVTGSGEFSNRSSENAWKVFKKALTYGVPRQLHSDNDSTFRANEQEGKIYPCCLQHKKTGKACCGQRKTAP